MSTTITTAARRIQRDLAHTPATTCTIYAPDGTVQGIRTGGPHIFAVHADDELGWTIILSGEDRTQREIQQLLDAAQWASEHHEEEHMSLSEAAGLYLQGSDI